MSDAPDIVVKLSPALHEWLLNEAEIRLKDISDRADPNEVAEAGRLMDLVVALDESVILRDQPTLGQAISIQITGLGQMIDGGVFNTLSHEHQKYLRNLLLAMLTWAIRARLTPFPDRPSAPVIPFRR